LNESLKAQTDGLVDGRGCLLDDERLLFLQLQIPTGQPLSFIVGYEFEQYHDAGECTLIRRERLLGNETEQAAGILGRRIRHDIGMHPANPGEHL
jgi:hypothetical protein